MKARLTALAGLLLTATALQAGTDPTIEASRYLERGNYRAAVKHLHSAAPFARDQTQARFLYATALAGAGEHDKAVQMFEQLIADFPEQPEPYNNLASLYADQGQLEKAKEILERAMRTHASYAAVYDNLSTIYVEMARASYIKALRVKEAPQTPKLQLLYAVKEPAVPAEAATLLATAEPAPTPTKPKVKAASVQEPSQAEVKAPAMEPARTEATEPVMAPAKAEVEVPATEPAKAEVKAPAMASSEPKAQAVPVPAPEPVQPPSNPVPPVAPTVEAQQPASVVTATPEPAPEAAPIAFLHEWAKAWSAGDVEAYLGFYAADFNAAGQSRAQWEAERRERLGKAQNISVVLEQPQVRLVNPGRAVITLVQQYSASNYSDRTRKQFILVKVDGRWRIRNEKSLGLAR